MKASFYCKICQTLVEREYPHGRSVKSPFGGSYLEHYRVTSDGQEFRPWEEMRCSCGGSMNCLCPEGMRFYLSYNYFVVQQRVATYPSV